jgi:hypothetical protein
LEESPLYLQKRTFGSASGMSAKGQKRTFQGSTAL